MSTAPFDPVQYKIQQRQGWDTVANGWRQWWPTFEQSAQSVSDRLVALAAIEPGHRVLDVATGIGEPAVTAARKVGTGGRVVATDLSPQMLAIARARASELALTNMDFRIMDAERPDLPAGTFHAILCRWGIMFFPDPVAALRALSRLLVPGGRLAAAVWADPPQVPIISLRTDVAARMLAPPPPPPGTPSAFSLADPSTVEAVFHGAGLSDVHTERLTAVFEFESLATFARFQEDVAGPRVPTLADQPPELQAQFWEAVATAARPYASLDETVRLPNELICVVGRR